MLRSLLLTILPTCKVYLDRDGVKEDDEVEILSGVFEGVTTGTPIGLIVRNQDQKSKDYSKITSE